MFSVGKRSNPFVFPYGARPGFDQNHIAARNPLISIYAQGGNFFNILQPGVGTITGTPGGSIDGALGPLVPTINQTNRIDSITGRTPPSFGSGNAATETMAGMAIITATGSFNYCDILQNGTTGLALGITTARQVQLNWQGQNSFTTTAALTLNRPYFILGSFKYSSGGAGAQTFLILDMLTGGVTVETFTAANNFTTGASSTYNVKGIGASGPTIKVACAMHSAVYLTEAQARAWATDPWSFWYPQATPRIIAVAPPAGGVVQQASATLAGAGALTASAKVIAGTAASLSGTGALSVTASLIETTGATLAGNGALSILAQLQQQTSAVLTGAGALSIDARAARSATATLAGAGALSVSANLILSATATLAGAGQINADASAANIRLASATLTGAGSLSVDARAARAATAILGGPLPVALLLHMEGADTSTAFIDSAGHLVAASGNAQIDTAQSKFGGSSALFNGSTDSLNLDGSADYAFGTGDFSVDCWIKLNTLGVFHNIYDSRTSEGAYVDLFINSSNILIYRVSSVSQIVGSTVLDTNWHHIALARSGTSTKLFVDGVQEGSTYSDSTNYLNDPSRPIIGTAGNGSGAWFNGWIDELRVLKGIAAWTSNFTPPTSAYNDPGAGRLDASASLALAASATLGGAGALTTTANIIAKAAATLGGSGALNANAGTTPSASATLAGAGSLSADARVARAASATLAGAGGISVSARLIQQASALFAGSGNLIGNATGGIVRATLTGSGSLTASARVIAKTSAILAGSGRFDSRANLLARVSATLVGSGLLNADAQAVSPSVIRNANATLNGAGGLTVDDSKVFVLRPVRGLNMECFIDGYGGDCFLSSYDAGVESADEDDGDSFIRTAA